MTAPDAQSYGSIWHTKQSRLAGRR